jgi:hypothetical protein
MKNILDLEMDKLATDAAEEINILLGAFNFFSPRFFFFF